MFDRFKTMGALAGLMQNQERLREAGERIKQAADETVVTGEAGGGAVRVEVSARMKVLSVSLDPSLSSSASVETDRVMAGELIAEAVNDGLGKAQEAMQEIVRAEAEGMGLPELPDELGGMFR